MTDAYGTFLPVLKIAVEELKPNSVLELGMGDNSSPYFHQLAIDGVSVMSYDNNPEWFAKYVDMFSAPNHSGICHPEVPYPVYHKAYDIALIDHAPGERRRVDMLRLLDRVKVFVVHDTQPSADGYGYFFSHIWHHFQYLNHDTIDGVRTTVASNTVDVTKWDLSKK